MEIKKNIHAELNYRYEEPRDSTDPLTYVDNLAFSLTVYNAGELGVVLWTAGMKNKADVVKLQEFLAHIVNELE